MQRTLPGRSVLTLKSGCKDSSSGHSFRASLFASSSMMSAWRTSEHISSSNLSTPSDKEAYISSCDGQALLGSGHGLRGPLNARIAVQGKACSSKVRDGRLQICITSCTHLLHGMLRICNLPGTMLRSSGSGRELNLIVRLLTRKGLPLDILLSLARCFSPLPFVSSSSSVSSSSFSQCSTPP